MMRGRERDLCEQLAHVAPERFRFDTWDSGWRILDRVTHDSVMHTDHVSSFWRFIGPIAQETEGGSELLACMFEMCIEKMGARP